MSNKDRLLKLADITYNAGLLNIFEDTIISIAKSKNVPTNKKLWDKAQSEARKKFDVHPSAYCVPQDNSFALTSSGWKSYHELTTNDKILCYDIDSDSLKYSPILALNAFEEQPIIKLNSSKINYSIECTPEHKKVVYFLHDETNDTEDLTVYTPDLFEAEALPKMDGHLVISAKLDSDYENADLEDYERSKDDPIKMVMSMSLSQLSQFLSLASQYYIESNFDTISLEAIKLATFLTGQTTKNRIPELDELPISISSQRTIPCDDLYISTSHELKDVWCPETLFETWVMKQGNTITITGNSNAWASKWYKEHGGGWKKKKIKKKNKAEDPMYLGTLSQVQEDSEETYNILDSLEEDDVPEWVESLISQVASDMSHVITYMKHEEKSDEMYLIQLSELKDSAGALLDIMENKEENEIPEWVESLVSDMAKDISHVLNYLKHNHHHKQASRLLNPLDYFMEKWSDYINNDLFKEAVYRNSGLGRWFKEKWVDISRKDKSGRYKPCGRSEGKPGKYPKCRPSKRVSKNTPETTKEMSAKEKKSAISQKRRKQRKRKSDGKGQKPIRDSHSKRD